MRLILALLAALLLIAQAAVAAPVAHRCAQIEYVAVPAQYPYTVWFANWYVPREIGPAFAATVDRQAPRRVVVEVAGTRIEFGGNVPFFLVAGDMILREEGRGIVVTVRSAMQHYACAPVEGE